MDINNMDDGIRDFIEKTTDYVVERSLSANSILEYHKQHYNDKVSLREFIFEIVYHANVYFYLCCEDEESISGIEEIDYVLEKTDHKDLEIVEIVLWFKNCYLMSEDCNTWVADCPGCGCDELYEKEVENGELFEFCLECKICGNRYTLDEVYNKDGSAGSDQCPERIPHKEPDLLEGLNPENQPVFTDRDAIYRFRVSRNIIELDGTKTLDDLSIAIQVEFGLDPERMSSFYMGKKLNKPDREISCTRLSPFIGEEHSTAENYEICRLNLFEKQKFLYLHDFFRDNRYNITFIGVRKGSS